MTSFATMFLLTFRCNTLRSHETRSATRFLTTLEAPAAGPRRLGCRAPIDDGDERGTRAARRSAPVKHQGLPQSPERCSSHYKTAVGRTCEAGCERDSGAARRFVSRCAQNWSPLLVP